jgi:hypothetical protein
VVVVGQNHVFQGSGGGDISITFRRLGMVIIGWGKGRAGKAVTYKIEAFTIIIINKPAKLEAGFLKMIAACSKMISKNWKSPWLFHNCVVSHPIYTNISKWTPTIPVQGDLGIWLLCMQI